MSRVQIRAASLLGCLCLVAAVADGQQSISIQSEPAVTIQDVTGLSGRGVASVTLRTLTSHSTRLAKRVSEASKALAESKTDDEREEAESQLRDAVAEQFDLVVNEREEQIAELQARLERLNTQLDERQAAKDEIVDLRVKVLINEAKGLGFYPVSGKSNPYSSGVSGLLDPMSLPGVTPRTLFPSSYTGRRR